MFMSYTGKLAEIAFFAALPNGLMDFFKQLEDFL